MNLAVMPQANPLKRNNIRPLSTLSNMKLQIAKDADTAARQAAEFIAERAREAIKNRGKFLLALSGGQTAGPMLRHLAAQDMPWTKVHVAQVDERVAPEGSPERNLTTLQQYLVTNGPLPAKRLYSMPVNSEDLSAATQQYAKTLEQLCGSPPIFDLVHLGLGTDGHTASLVPGDPVLRIIDLDVALTNLYQGLRRMTLTYPIINRSRNILWLVTGAQKASVLARLYNGDNLIPAGLINRECTVIFADHVARSNISQQ